MTITIADGRGALWQWDTGRRVKITDGDGVKQIHYQNRALGGSVDVDVGADGKAIIPDELLQDWHPLTAYAYVTDDAGGYTKVQVDFAVHKRARPSGYVYTPTDQMTLQTIQRQIGDLADLTTEAKDTLVAAINEAVRTGGGAGSMDLHVADGYIQYSTDGGSTWQNLIAVADLKGADGAPGKDGADGANGKDGADGKPGAAGADGITPHIGDNGNWYVGSTDTGKPSRGAIGAPGKDGAGMDITGATVGQIAKITAVDASGVPTAWAPVDMPSVEEWEDMGTVTVEDGTAYIQVDLPYPVKKLYISTASSAAAILSSGNGLRIATAPTAYNAQFFGCTPSTYNGNTWSASIWLIDFTKADPIQLFSVGANAQASALPSVSLFSNAGYANTMTPQQFFIVPGSGATVNASTWTIWGVKA